MSDRPEVHLRMLTSEDAGWLVQVDTDSRSAVARQHDWNEEKLAAELDEGVWASDGRFGWAIVVDGTPGGFALVRGIALGDAEMDLRVARALRGRGIGREVLRQLADHHFTSSGSVHRLFGRTHEHNVPMQRAFNAAGFRMEARYRDSYLQPDGRFVAEWGYALTRGDWEAGHHRADDQGYDLHGLLFVVEDVLEGISNRELLFRFLQDGRRALARYGGGHVADGELAGVLVGDVLRYRYVEDEDGGDGLRVVTGGGIARIQRRGDGRLEVVNDWSDDLGRHGKTFLVERRRSDQVNGASSDDYRDEVEATRR